MADRFFSKSVGLFGWLAGIILAALGGCRTVPPPQRAHPVEYVLAIYADRPWQNSGIAVAEGQVIHCLAEGKWGDDFGAYGPEGDASRQRDSFGVAAPAHGLLMKISSQTNRVYYIGRQAHITAERGGHLYFRCNAPVTPGVYGSVKATVMPAHDADGDGLSDYEEIYIWRTNPRRSDSYGAGFTDLETMQEQRRQFGSVLLPDNRRTAP